MFIDHKANFSEHKVTYEGLYIRGMSHDFEAVEIFVDREQAEAMGWIDPLIQEFASGEITIITTQGEMEVTAKTHECGLAYHLTSKGVAYQITPLNSGFALNTNRVIKTPELAEQFIREISDMLTWTKSTDELRNEARIKFGVYGKLQEALNQALDKAKKALAEEMVEA